MRVYNLEGRRDNKYKARVKILVHEIGLEEFRARVEAEFATLDGPSVNADPAEVERIATYFAPPPMRRSPPSAAPSRRRRPAIRVSRAGPTPISSRTGSRAMRP